MPDDLTDPEEGTNDDIGGDDTDPFPDDDEPVTGDEGESLLSEDGLSRTFRLKKPGTKANATRVDDFELLNPTNTSSCNCSVFIASFDSAGRIIAGSNVELFPGNSRASYTAAPGASFIAISCSGGCNPDDPCSCELTVSVAVS
jgi:hypothetical protein